MYLPLRKHLSFLSPVRSQVAARLARFTMAGVVLVSPLFLATAAPEAEGANPAAFVEVSASLGISVTPTGQREDWGHGAAFCDYDNDNDLDLYVVMGAGQANKLFENRGASGFVDVAAAAGVADMANGRAVVWADYDNDGDKDMFVSNYLVPSRLYRNNGDGTFTNRAAAAGITAVGKSHSAAWADYDNDGNLDLFVGNYGIAAVPDPNLLYHSNGDGTFTEVAASAGVADSTKPALACTWVDYDGDNDLDLYIAYDKTKGNVLYRNNGDGTFTDVSVASNTDIAFNAMGIAVGDYDHNGYLDMYVTNTPPMPPNTPGGNELLHNNGDGTFNQVAVPLGVAVNKISWGTAFLDYDNDGDEDLYVMNWSMAMPPVNAENTLYRNDGGTFTDVSTTSGADDADPGFAVTTGDFNNDGYVDIFVNNMNYPSKLFECVPGTFKWLKIKTVGTLSNRDGIGAKIRVVTGGLEQMKDVRSGSSYLSGLSHEVEFGLGAASNIDTIEVSWPSGIRDLFTDVVPNQFLVANEGGTLHPVPVFITSFLAAPVAGGVELSWAVVSDEAIQGFNVYRKEGTGTEVRVNRGGLIAPLERRYVDDGVRPGGRYRYGLGVIQEDGSEMRSAQVPVTAPAGRVALEQNYPNPFNPTTTIRFVLAGADHVSLTVFDAGGRHVKTLVDEVRAVGPQEVTWSGRNEAGQPVATGIYFYRLRTGAQVLTRKMILLK